MSGAGGRPTDYTPELGEEIAWRMIHGPQGRPIGLERLCDMCEDLPSARTAWTWQNKHPEFLQMIERARPRQGDVLAWEGYEDIHNIADVDDSKIVFVRNKHRQYMASRLARRDWGDKISQEISGPDGEPVRMSTISEEPLAKDDFDKQFGVTVAE